MTQTPSSSPATVLQLVTDYPTAQVIHVAAQLRLADLLAAGPRRVEELADATDTHAPSLARLLRMLAALGVVEQEADGRISLTPVGAPLRAASLGRCAIASSSWSGPGTGAHEAACSTASRPASQRSTAFSA